MKEIVFLSPASPGAVRTAKFAQHLANRNFKLSYWGWARQSADKNKVYSYFDNINYILCGGGSGTKILPLYYCWLIIKLSLLLLIKKHDGRIYLATNFETAFSCWFSSHFRKFTYIYDIWDELAISHLFPGYIVKLIRFFDKKIRKRAAFYIHVDENRISDIDGSNYIILYNSPIDFLNSSTLKPKRNCFAVTGWLNKTRGMQSIYEFAKNNPQIEFIVAGAFLQKEYEELYSQLPNVRHYNFMPQNELFKLIINCRGIFSLYDTTIPINRLAASNKLYDAMMLSIPVIVNEGLEATDFVRKNGIGYVVNYEFDKTWDVLKEYDLETVNSIGIKGREIYLNRFEFTSMLDRILIPRLVEL